jgi:Tol biopolymer transport system component
VNWPVAAAALLLGALLASAYFYLSQPIPELKPLNRVEISLPGFSTVAFPALSPTREYMVFAGINGEGAGGVFVREMGSGTIRMIAQSENLGEREIRFSPTGDRLAMTAGSNDGVFLVDVPNGIPERLTETGRFSFWIDNEEIIVSDDREGGGGGILRVRTDTGEMIPLEISASALGAGYGNIPKTLIPGTERVFGHQLRRLASGNIDPNDPVDLFSLDMKSGSLEIIVNNAINPEFVHGGFLIYQIGTDTGELVWRPIDERTGRPTGQQRDLFSGDARPFWSEYFVDQTGDLIFVDLIRNAEADPLLWEADLDTRQVRSIPVRLTGQQFPVDVSYSPDGSAVVFTGGRENGVGNIYTYDLSRDQQVQYTYDDSSGAARYTADGRALVVSTGVRGQVSLATFPVGNVAGAETLRIDAGNAEFSRDGRWMSFIAGPDSNRPRLVVKDLRSGALSVLDSTSTLPLMAEFSPDGRYIAYMTDPSRFSEIIVHAVSGRQRVVVPGIAGQIPKWGPDGNYLYYANRDGIYRLPVQTDPSFSVVGVPEQVLWVLFLASFDLDSAGSRIVVSAASTGFVGDLETSASRLIWLQNLSDEFKRQSER